MDYLIFIAGFVVGAGFGYWLGFRNKRGRYIHPQVQEKEKRKRQIESLVEERGKITNDDVQELLGVSDATATNYLEELEQEGKIKQIGETGRGVYYKLEK